MAKKTKRQALEDVALFSFSQKDMTHHEYIKALAVIKKMTDAEVNTKFKDLKNSVNAKFNDEKIIKEFDQSGSLKTDYEILESQPLVYTPAVKVSLREQRQAVAKQVRVSKDPVYLEAVNTYGQIYNWSPEVVSALYLYLTSK